jgi:hypothetical protein
MQHQRDECDPKAEAAVHRRKCSGNEIPAHLASSAENLLTFRVRREGASNEGQTLFNAHPGSESVAGFLQGGKNNETTATLSGPAAAAKTEIKGAAILDHPCGKVAVKQMGLVHAGKMDEANKLTTKEMQDQWKAMPAKDRTMMSGMMKDMSQTEAQFSADIKSSGLLVVDGPAATLTVKKTTKDANGSSTSTTTQEFKINGNECLITH